MNKNTYIIKFIYLFHICFKAENKFVFFFYEKYDSCYSFLTLWVAFPFLKEFT